MKVICLGEARHNHITLAEEKSPIEVGEYYNVIHRQEEFGILYYALAEFGMDIGFDAKCFGIISTIDETEIHSKTETAPELIK